MDHAERAYRKAEAEERRLLLGDDKSSPHKKKKPPPLPPRDYDPDDLPPDYVAPYVATVLPGRILVGPPCVTKRQRRYLRERQGDPHVVQLALPPAAERRLWKPAEAAAWYGSYARTLLKEVVNGARGAVYLCHETGCDEEVVVALVLWCLLYPEGGAGVPRTPAQFVEWRAAREYLWMLDRDEDAQLAVVALCADDIAAKSMVSSAARRNGQACMQAWLGGKKK